MTIQEILAGGGGLLLILMTLVQIAPVKINPWSALAKAIGKAINADISKRLDEIEKSWTHISKRMIKAGPMTGERRYSALIMSCFVRSVIRRKNS